jgi:hypothetical protein
MTTLSPLLQFTHYWREIYSDTNPKAKLAAFDHIALQEVMSRMDSRHYPEPFYGLWDDDLSRGGVLLLINPGQVLKRAYVRSIEVIGKAVKQIPQRILLRCPTTDHYTYLRR